MLSRARDLEPREVAGPESENGGDEEALHAILPRHARLRARLHGGFKVERDKGGLGGQNTLTHTGRRFRGRLCWTDQIVKINTIAFFDGYNLLVACLPGVIASGERIL